MSARCERLLLFVLVTLLVAVGSANAAIRFDGRFPSGTAPQVTQAGGNIGNWAFVDFTDPGNANVLAYNTTLRRGTHAAADITIKPQAGERIEFSKDVFPGTTGEGKDVWFAWSVRLPSKLTDGTPFRLPPIMNLMQIPTRYVATYCGLGHNQEIGISYTGSTPRDAHIWRAQVVGGNGSCTAKPFTMPQIPIVRDLWYDWSCHYHFTSVAANAQNTCYYRINGSAWALGFNAPGVANLVRSPSFAGNVQVRHGFYRPGHWAQTYWQNSRVVQGGLVIADTRAEAEAAAFG